MQQDVICRAPARTSVLGDVAPDDSAAIFGLLLEGRSAGLRGALLTLVDRTGGSARAIGAQMAVLEDGRFTGYLSSGCLEAVIAAEAIKQMRLGKNIVLRFGVGSPFFDVRLPCGSSIDVLIDVTITEAQVQQAVDSLANRRTFSLLLSASEPARLVDTARRSGWHDDYFVRGYAAPLQILALGRGLEFEAVARLSVAAGYPTRAFCADDAGVERLGESGIGTIRLTRPSSPPALPLDSNTAVVLLFHDHDWETAILSQALSSSCRYIGAMGSTTTHRQRCERLLALGHTLAEIDRVRGPIGLFGPTRDASTLAISVLAELAQIGAAQ
jgi:xanthine dehydrogenase accessory factor